jgi:uncharacterized protein (TIGR00255 family)
MIYSMTGYAVATKESSPGTLNVELRSVNHRYLDIQFRLPDDLRSIEPALRELLSAKLNRGKIECRVSFAANTGAGRTIEINESLLRQLIQLDARVRGIFAASAGLSVSDILRWPGMLAAETLPVEELKAACSELLQTVLDDFMATRAREGEKLKEMLLERTSTMEKLVAGVAPSMPAVIASFQEKLAARLREVMVSGDEERIRQEVAIFANKIDIDEELSRLAAHISELRRILEEGGAVGKRLDFLMQELNREANTLASKSADIAVTQVSIDLKLLIEQMREQIQNIE